MEKKKLGILGGMGSEATVLFYKKIIDNTSVNNDREHLDILIYNHASIPDRTECILCGKQDYLWDIIANDIPWNGAGWVVNILPFRAIPAIILQIGCRN